jgi:hypothetical protein
MKNIETEGEKIMCSKQGLRLILTKFFRLISLYIVGQNT